MPVTGSWSGRWFPAHRLGQLGQRERFKNLAPFSFFAPVGAAPPMVAFSPVNRPDGSKKDTVANIEETGTFVVNLVDEAVSQAMVASSAEVPAEVDEFDLAGIETLPSLRVEPPRVAASPAQLECRLHQIVRLGRGPWQQTWLSARL